MKKIILFFILGISLSATGQKLYPVKVETDSMTFSLAEKNRQFFIEPRGSGTLFKPRKDFPKIDSFFIRESDLVVHYSPKKADDLLSYNISLALKFPDGRILTPGPLELTYAAGSNGGRELIWLDALEFVEDFGAVYTVFVQRSLMGAVNCEGSRPEMSTTLKGLSYVGSGVGLGFLMIGWNYAKEKNQSYARYKKLWTDGNALTDPTADPLAETKKDAKNARIFLGTGIGIIAANAIIFNVISFKIKKKQHYYDKFCGAADKTSFFFTPSKTGAGIVLNF